MAVGFEVVSNVVSVIQVFVVSLVALDADVVSVDSVIQV